jgi:hypothetical protein
VFRAEDTSTGAAMAGAPGPAASDHVPVFFVYIISMLWGPDAWGGIVRVHE